MSDTTRKIEYPAGLLDWAGHRLGGVRRLFHSTSGRPSGQVIRTRLLDRLDGWAHALGATGSDAPRVVLLVGGPGNGKTEAVEFVVSALDMALGARGKLVERAASQFDGTTNASTSPRLVSIELGDISDRPGIETLHVVQDASVRGGGSNPASPPTALVADLQRLVVQGDQTIYLACVNRGVLDDALVCATDTNQHDAARLLEVIIKSVGVSPEAPACWPLAGYPSVGVWPMDVESLIEGRESGEDLAHAARQILDKATDESLWKPAGTCPAGTRCPFCTSQQQLSGEPHRSALLQVLRWYEIASGKRWSFRDLFSLISYLLASVPANTGTGTNDPCSWAAGLVALASQPGSKHEAQKLAAPFILAGAQYQHALFATWPRGGTRSLKRDLQELKLDKHPVLLGFFHFLAGRRGASFPATLESQLIGLCDLLDPAVADPDMEVAVSAHTTIKFRDLDTRFSQSVGEGLKYIRKYQCLTVLEMDVLAKLDEADRCLSDPDVVNRKPAIAARVQLLVRDFACRFTRRSVGARCASVRNKDILADFQRVIEGDNVLLHEAVKQVEGLLNARDHFVVTLNTTFGEPLPPGQRRATLTTDKQKVRPRPLPGSDRPTASLRFLGVGSGSSSQSIPLTYELFKSVRELRQGMMPASLPRPVIALLDTTRARLAGTIVRDEELLEGAEIRLGNRDDIIVRERCEFVVTTGGNDSER